MRQHTSYRIHAQLFSSKTLSDTSASFQFRETPTLCLCACASQLPEPPLPRTSAAVAHVRQHMSAYVSIRQHTSPWLCPYASQAALTATAANLAMHTLHTLAYVSMRWHMVAYVIIQLPSPPLPQTLPSPPTAKRVRSPWMLSCSAVSSSSSSWRACAIANR